MTKRSPINEYDTSMSFPPSLQLEKDTLWNPQVFRENFWKFFMTDRQSAERLAIDDLEHSEAFCIREAAFQCQTAGKRASTPRRPYHQHSLGPLLIVSPTFHAICVIVTLRAHPPEKAGDVGLMADLMKDLDDPEMMKEVEKLMKVKMLWKDDQTLQSWSFFFKHIKSLVCVGR